MRNENGPPLAEQRQAGEIEFYGANYDYAPVYTISANPHQHLNFAERLIACRFHLPPHVARQICRLAGLGGRDAK